MKITFKIVILCACVLLISACAIPDISRDLPETIKLRASGSVKPEAALNLVACITEGFQGIPQSIMHNHLTTQQVIAKGNRIELRGTLGGTLMTSADVFGDGNASIYTTIYNDIVSSAKDQSDQGVIVFRNCLQKLGKVQ